MFFFVAILETERVNKALCTFDYFNLCGAGSTQKVKHIDYCGGAAFPKSAYRMTCTVKNNKQ